ncbi:MAG: SHOCT domain-containing protein [Nitrospira sp.]|nr:SHOCT domain-containing protein [Nitrospira sp.]MCA9456005.1 SHOCT domain-containing protein [Nitrospira sp.]HQU29522.1 SHOCT domain-containing protein [Nitrospirales bacterium]
MDARNGNVVWTSHYCSVLHSDYLGNWFLVTALMSRGSEGSTPPESALEILKKQYARGEINKEEFEEKRKDLE